MEIREEPSKQAEKIDYDLMVIGGGAAGLMASIRAAERGLKVLLLEKNPRLGVKILMSGGTRCNITHNCDNRALIAAYGKNGQFLHSALASWSIQDTIQFFHGEGVLTKVEETGKIFPVSDRAVDVLAALVNRLRRTDAEIALGEAVTDIQPCLNGFTVSTKKRSYFVRQLIVTTGGKSYPGCGTNGDGYKFLEKLGHTIVPTRPALVPIRVDLPSLASLRGVTLPHIQLQVLENQKAIYKTRNSLLFAHFGLSGPAALDASKAISRHANPERLQIELDYLPSISIEEYQSRIQKLTSQEGRKLLAVVFSQVLPRSLVESLMTQIDLPLDRKTAGLTKLEREKWVQIVKHHRIRVLGTLGFEKAEVTSGGISLLEVDSKTMQSKIVPGLFIAGEILDLDGPIGGYNFQIAWSTGYLAGNSAGK